MHCKKKRLIIAELNSEDIAGCVLGCGVGCVGVCWRMWGVYDQGMTVEIVEVYLKFFRDACVLLFGMVSLLHWNLVNCIFVHLTSLKTNQSHEIRYRWDYILHMNCMCISKYVVDSRIFPGMLWPIGIPNWVFICVFIVLSNLRVQNASIIFVPIIRVSENKYNVFPGLTISYYWSRE